MREFDEDLDDVVFAWNGQPVGFRLDRFHLYDQAGGYLGSHACLFNSRFRAKEIFDGRRRYIGETRRGRLIFDHSKAASKPLAGPPLQFVPSRFPIAPPSPWPPAHQPWLKIPEGYSPFTGKPAPAYQAYFAG